MIDLIFDSFIFFMIIFIPSKNNYNAKPIY